MNLNDSAFLCLDIGSSAVHGIAHRVRGARIVRSAMFVCESFDTVSAIKTVIDEMESQIGRHFDYAYITGNFGESRFSISGKSTIWSNDHKITATDVKNQASKIPAPDGFFPMHIIPLRYDSPHIRNMLSPIGHIDNQLMSTYASIFYSRGAIGEINSTLRHAHIQSNGFYDPGFVLAATYGRPHEITMYIDLGAQYTTASIWADRRPLWHYKTPMGGTNMSQSIADKFNIPFVDADRIKRAVFTMLPSQTDRFAPADIAYDFSRADINDIVVPYMQSIIDDIRLAAMPIIEKHQPTKIILSGGAADADGVVDFISNAFGLPCESVHGDAIVRALGEYIWNSYADVRAKIIARHDRNSKRIERILKIFHRKPKKRHVFVPILPSSMCFDMNNPATYTTFDTANISMIHIDIMDGLYVNKIAGSIDQIRAIRSRTTAHLHVHLMTESPNAWAADAIAAGADTVIVSTNTSGVKNAIRTIKSSGRRAGIALNPNTPPSILKPILRDLDEVMVMTVEPGASGQEFMPACLHKISVLAATRKKYGLKFTISVDGGITDKNAQMCWDAGADLLVSGSYLSHSTDFPIAVQSLLKKH
ncbi:MAG: ribulose-phosphate 3-epimerase [Alphaproteobacteria bacterium]|nr:ribulose-phosphate 3-epimerase [Alphaproteobacteria bacterium]